MEAKEAAFKLFNEGVSQKDIAQILNKAEKTVSGWATEGLWEKKRTEASLQKQNSERGVWELINHQLKVLKLIKDIHEKTLDGITDLDQLKKVLIDKGDIDALQKLFTTVRGKEMEWTQRVKAIKDFIEYLEDQNLTLAKDVLPIAHEYLNQKRSEM